MLKRSLLRQIRGSLGRYLAILAIIALGVGFFAGLRVTKTAMVDTADAYLNELNLFDFRLVSTLGLTQEDVDSFSALDGVSQAVGSVSVDFLRETDDGAQSVLHAHMLTDGVNGVDLVAGRMPERGDECVVDALSFPESSIGEQIVLSSGNTGDTLDQFAYDAYTIVGVANAAYYINFERGSTSLGSGTVSGFVYLPADGFDSEYFTELFLTVERAGEIYSDEYQAQIDALTPAVEQLLEQRAQLRYDTLRADAIDQIEQAQSELDDGRATYESERADAEAQLADAQQQLADSRAELDDGWASLADGREELAQQRADAQAQFDAAEAELAATLETLDETLSQLDSARTLLTAGETLTAGIDAALGTAYGEPAALVAALSAGEDPMLSAAVEQALSSSDMTVTEFLEAWTAAEAALGAPLSTQTLAAAQAQLDAGREQYDSGVQQLAASRADAEAQFAAAEQELSDAEQTLRDGETSYAEGLAEYEQSERDAQSEFADAEQELIDAQAEIDDAWAEVDEIEPATVYVLDRTTNVGYASLENDASIVEGVSRVFPLFFFLVAALVCVTTMTRMVEEQRTQTGVLKALGFCNGAIAGQFLAYAGSASAIGCVSGFLLGSWLLPMVLWEVYQIMYDINRSVAFVLDWGLFALCTLMYLVCALGATWLVCRRSLSEAAAELIRPKAPKAGKRILFERVKFIWKRVPFLYKVSIRNILRYKKRMLMMIIGIGGCTALILTGFGIRDSIQNIVDFQYDEIDLYDCAVVFRSEPSETRRAALLEACGDQVEDVLYLHAGSADVTGDGQTVTANLIVSDEPVSGFVSLHDDSGELAWPQTGEALINYRLADACGIAVGDTITLRCGDDGTLRVRIAGIFDNYINDYIYISADTCRDQWGSAPEMSTAYLLAADGADVHQLAADALGVSGVAQVSVNDDMRERVGSMLTSLDYVVLIILLFAGALAFIVLYNLANITITERQREIATLKVLGFYPRETGAYVFRENLIQTAISGLVGLPLGVALHWYVMSQIKISGIYFDCRIAPLSYVLAYVLTFAFAAIVAVFLYFKLDRINMAESLKSIE